MLKVVYYIIVSDTFDRDPIEFNEQPTDAEIINAIKEKKGKTARVEKRYILVEVNTQKEFVKGDSFI